MTPLATPTVDWGALGQVVWVALLAGVLLVVAASAAIVGAARASAERREGRSGAAGVYVALLVAGVAVCAAEVVLGVTVMLNKR